MTVEQHNVPGVGFRASPVDQAMDAIERLPVPSWLVYLACFFLEAALFHLISWQDGWVDRYVLEPVNFLFPLWMWAPLMAMTYLDGVALQSLRAFAPLLEADPESQERIEYEFTHMPAVPVLISALLWVLIYAGLMLISFGPFLELYRLGPVAMWFAGITGLITFPIGGVLYYHTLRQLRLVNKTLGRVKQFNLFQMEPVYAFSRLTSHTGLIWLALLTLTQVFFPARLVTGWTLAIYIVQALLALAAFVLPLWNVHQRLVAEKRRLLAEVDQRLDSKLQRMHRSLDSDHLDEMEVILHALQGLADEREILGKIPTWPWRSGTITGFASAMLLPVLLLLIQIVIERLLVP